MIHETEMGNRGSKSSALGIDSVTVKEQRVYGNWCKGFRHLRCTLTGFERSGLLGPFLRQTLGNYQIGIPSNQINKLRSYTSFITHKPIHEFTLNPWFITGFSDAEGSFSILIQPNNKYITNYRVKAIFAIGLHKKDVIILDKIQSALGVGKIHKHGENSVQFRVESIKELQIVINHFDNYPLVSAKGVDYTLFKQAFNIIKSQNHLVEKGLLELVGIKASLNLGLSPGLKEAFPNWKDIQLERPDFIFTNIPDPNWLAGFSSGDGSFNIKIGSSTSTRSGYRVQLRFSIGLNIREKVLIESIVTYFNLEGSSIKSKSVSEDSAPEHKNVYFGSNSVNLQVVRLSDIMDKIIPFFEKYPIQGQKSLDFKDFKRVTYMLNNKEHLTSEGLNKILEIKASMNEERI